MLSWKLAFNSISWLLILHLAFGMLPLRINPLVRSCLAQLLGFSCIFIGLTESPTGLSWGVYLGNHLLGYLQGNYLLRLGLT